MLQEKNLVYVLRGKELYSTIKQVFSECLNTNSHNSEPSEKKHIELLTTEQLADRLKITIQTVHRWRKKNRISYIKIGKSFRYDYAIVIHELKNKKGGKI